MSTTSRDKNWKPPAGGYNAAVDFVDRNVAEGRGSKAAFLDPGRTLTYGALQERCDRVVNALSRLGIGRERRVAMIMLDTLDFPAVFWGAIKAGVVPVPLNTLLPPEQWRFMIEDSRAEAVFLAAELAERAGPMLEEIARTRRLPVIVAGREGEGIAPGLEALLTEGPATAKPADTHADEVAFWLYSSGSTGTPKGTRHVQASLAHTAHCYGQGVLGVRVEDVVFSAAKLFFAYGLGNAMSFPMWVGATTVLMPERPTPDAVFALLEMHQPTILYAVPTLYAAMLASPALGKGAGSRRLRLCVSAGEALPEEIGQRWHERVGVEILDGIGSTEMLHIFISNRPGGVRYGSSGTPVPGYEARLVDENGAAAKPGEIGELLIKGPSAAEGYWNQRQKSRRTFAGEWTVTGDKYRLDADGYYIYCGRSDDMFKVSGMWVSPFEVESALISHAAVLEAAVVGKEDGDGLVKPQAFVVLKPGFAADAALFADLKSHVKAKAGSWKYPRWIEVRAELPKTATGKIQRFKLRGGT